MTGLVLPRKHFSPQAVFECGQVFRYAKVSGAAAAAGAAVWEVFSGNKRCLVTEKDDEVIVSANKADLPYFINYFDLETDYAPILRALGKLCPKEALRHGKGLRLLRQDKWETLVSFIISTNNNIPRIRLIIEKLCAALGKKRGKGSAVWYGFPAPEAMAAQDEAFYRSIGCGYRSPWLAEAARKVAPGQARGQGVDLEAWGALPTEELVAALQSFSGVGPKAADCVALFAYGRLDTFPVDTWVKKIYRDLFPRELRPQNAGRVTEKTMRADLIRRFGKYSGAAQQFLFHYYRSLL